MKVFRRVVGELGWDFWPRSGMRGGNMRRTSRWQHLGPVMAPGGTLEDPVG